MRPLQVARQCCCREALRVPLRESAPHVTRILPTAGQMPTRKGQDRGRELGLVDRHERAPDVRCVAGLTPGLVQPGTAADVARRVEIGEDVGCDKGIQLHFLAGEELDCFCHRNVCQYVAVAVGWRVCVKLSWGLGEYLISNLSKAFEVVSIWVLPLPRPPLSLSLLPFRHTSCCVVILDDSFCKFLSDLIALLSPIVFWSLLA